MSTATITPAADAVLAVADRLRPEEREKVVWVLVRSLYPALRPEMFSSTADLVEYLSAKPDVVVGNE